MKTGLLQTAAVVTMSALVATQARAAFMVEAHTSGLANANFYYNGSVPPTPSIPSTAYGVTATNSVYGGSATDEPDTYRFSYTPGIDADNVVIPPKTGLGNGDLASGLTGGTTGRYNVYITWPLTMGTNPAGCRITITSDGENIVLDPVDINSGGTGNPGANNAWYRIGSGIGLTAGNTYTVTQVAHENSFVSMRSHGVMWEMVPEPATLLLLGLGGLLMRRLN